MSNMFKGMGEAASTAAATKYGESYSSGNPLEKALMRVSQSGAFGDEEEDENGMKKRRRMEYEPDLSSFVSLRSQPGQAGNMMNLYRNLYQSYGGRPTMGGLLGE